MRFNPADSSKQRTCDADQWKSFSLPENVFSALVYLAAHPGNQFRGSGGRWEGQYGGKVNMVTFYFTSELQRPLCHSPQDEDCVKEMKNVCEERGSSLSFQSDTGIMPPSSLNGVADV